MHGLNVKQAVSYTSNNINTSNAAPTSQLGFVKTYSPDTPVQLRGIFGSTGDVQYYIKRLYNVVTLYNATVYPAYVTATWIRARNDTASDIEVIQGQDAFGITIPYISQFTGVDFQKQFKIIRSKTFYMKPGKHYKFKIKSILSGRTKAITMDVEGSTAYAQKRGNTLLQFKYAGSPIKYVGQTTAEVKTVLSPLDIRGVLQTYCSYYNMADDDPDSFLLAQLDPTISGTGGTGYNIAVNPVYVNTNIPAQNNSSRATQPNVVTQTVPQV